MKLISTVLLFFTLLSGCAALQPADLNRQLWRLKFAGGIEGDFDLPVKLQEITAEQAEISFSFNQKLKLSGLSEGDFSVSARGKIINGELKGEIFGNSCFEIAGFCGSITGTMTGTMAKDQGSGPIEMTAKVREVRNITNYNFVGNWSLLKSGRDNLNHPNISKQNNLPKKPK